MTRTRTSLTALALLLGTVAPALAQTPPAHDVKRPFEWDKETIALFSEIAVQDGGRVKPIDTYAGFKLLKLAGRRSCEAPEGTLTPVPWLLDCLFFPEVAQTYPCFLIQDAQVLDRMGNAHEGKKKRDRYTYNELAPDLDKLFSLAEQLSKKDEKERDSVETQVLLLAHNVREFEELIHCLDFARYELPLHATPGLDRLYPKEAKYLSAAISHSRELVAIFHELDQATNLDPKRKEEEQDALKKLVGEIEVATRRSYALAIFPPSAPLSQETEWMSVGPSPFRETARSHPTDLTTASFQGQEPLAQQIVLLSILEDMTQSTGKLDVFKAKLRLLHDGLRDLAQARGEYAKIPLEVSFYKGDFFYRALLLFVFAFVVSAFSWTRPESKILFRGSLALTALGALLVVTGIVLRCIIRSRPPVSTLYETILFITGVACVSCLVVEYLNRQRIAASVAAALGMAGMFLANKYEFKESVTAGDTMPSLVAVLDTNFWLATHVTSVTMGYSAGLLASAIAHVWLVGQMLGVRKGDVKFWKNITRMIYGVLCFGLLFSTVGTILGGIWANYSWGRFWGWDPKENGALMICLWELIIFHARLGGYIRDYGLAVMSILGGCVIAFSWWGVNLLGVGLHSYGFTSGVLQILIGSYVIEALLVLVSAGWRLGGQGASPPTAPTATT
jgi:ABC-type transport system involved in cytochrome c biogenesis permease subunit